MRAVLHNRAGARGAVATLLLALLLISLAPAALAAESGSCGDNLRWTLSGGTLSITGSGDMFDYSDEGGLPAWYAYADRITALSLPQKLTRIGDIAFFGLYQLRSVSVPSQVTSIGDYAFAECTGLLSVTLPDGLRSIGEAAFSECSSLSAIRLPGTLSSLGNKAFYRCVSLSSVSVPASVTQMGVQVYAYCTGLVQADVGAHISTLPNWTFYGCTSLSYVTLSDTITGTGSKAMENCNALSAIYTKTYDVDVAAQIQEEVSADNEYFSENGYVAEYDPPEVAVVTEPTENGYITTEVKESEHAVIVTTEETEIRNVGSDVITVDISASLEDSEGWSEVRDQVMDAFEDGLRSVQVSVQLPDSSIRSEDLSPLSGQNVSLTITTAQGAVWHVDMADNRLSSGEGTMDLSYTLEKARSNNGIRADAVWLLRFQNSFSLKASVAVALPEDYSYQRATLYQNKEKLTSSIVDAASTAWFSLDGVQKNVNYYLAINDSSVEPAEAKIPETLYSNYVAQDEYGTLTDAQGNRYAVGERSSRWGITGKQFTVYVVLGLVVLVAIIATVMIYLNHSSQVKAKYARKAAEDKAARLRAEEEAAMYNEILREMLGDQPVKADLPGKE